mgnify:FL=1
MPHYEIVKEAGAKVKCQMCGFEFQIRNRRQRRCPNCGAIELWSSLEA